MNENPLSFECLQTRHTSCNGNCRCYCHGQIERINVLPGFHEIIPEAKDYLINVEGIKELNQAQKDILAQDFLDYDSNFVVATHTGTGKTALAQLRIVYALKKNQKVVYISPYKAIAEEKKEDFEYYVKYDWRVISSTDPDESNDRIDYSKFDIISMTYEKFDSVLNNPHHLNSWLNEVGLLVVDEGHMISDSNRGATLEAALTKLLTMSNNRIRVVLLSAVLPNVNQVAGWLRAKKGTSNWRPVDLEVGFVIYDKDLKKKKSDREANSNRQLVGATARSSKYDVAPGKMIVRYGSIAELNKALTNTKLPMDMPSQLKDTVLDNFLNIILPHEEIYHDIDDPLWHLTEQVLDTNGQVLVFTTDRRSTESVATKLAAAMAGSLHFRNYFSEDDEKEIENYISRIDVKNDKLAAAMKQGVGFHHGGIGLATRKLVERAYKARNLKIIVCTTTLIAGVNLPATLVLFNSISFWGAEGPSLMTKRDFLNGCGRAGRPGYEKRGRALFISPAISSALSYITRPIENVESQFQLDNLLFQSLALIKRSMDAGQASTSLGEITAFFNNSYYAACGFRIDPQSYVEKLLRMGMIKHHQENEKTIPSRFSITPLGYETIRFYVQPRTGYIISELVRVIRAHFAKKEYCSRGLFVVIEAPEELTAFTIVHALLYSSEVKKLLKFTTSKAREIEFKNSHFKELACNREGYEDPPFTEDDRKTLATSMALIDKLDMNDIEKPSEFSEHYDKFGDGDFASLQEILSWLLGASLRITKVLLSEDENLNSVTRILERLLQRITNDMIKEELIELCSVREVGRIRSLKLSKIGVIDLIELTDPKNKSLVTQAVGSEKVAEKIIANAIKMRN